MLKKGPRVVITPGVAGSPGVEERVVCPPAAPDTAPKPRQRNGYYMTLCVTPSVEVDGKTYYPGIPVCSKVWVET